CAARRASLRRHRRERRRNMHTSPGEACDARARAACPGRLHVRRQGLPERGLRSCPVTPRAAEDRPGLPGTGAQRAMYHQRAPSRVRTSMTLASHRCLFAAALAWLPLSSSAAQPAPPAADAPPGKVERAEATARAAQLTPIVPNPGEPTRP